MSCSGIVSIHADKPSQGIEELRNSWGSAPVVWNYLAQKYLGRTANSFLSDLESIWPLFDDPGIPRHVRIVLGMTFDRCAVSRKDFEEVACAIDLFLIDANVGHDYVNHWPRIAEALRSTDAETIGIHHTSVSENPYDTWNEKTETTSPVDWEALFFVIQQLELRDAESTEPEPTP